VGVLLSLLLRVSIGSFARSRDQIKDQEEKNGFRAYKQSTRNCQHRQGEKGQGNMVNVSRI
jgi:hypothetical protein